ncbi:MAG: type II secretion system protein [Candidatus Omnitrophica bacterium]|nr:type II secretion system protein [Candidatus Omnitrophota bacterium]
MCRSQLIYRKIKLKKAFTLIELIVVTVLLTILVGFVAWTFIVGLRTWNSAMNRADIRQNGNIAIERMVRDLGRTVTITDADDDTITITVDLDNDGTEETVTFDMSGTDLQRTVDGTIRVLSPDVETFELSYRDVDDNLMSIPADVSNQAKRDNIRVVGISLDMSKSDDSITLVSSAYCRNQGT